MYRNILAAVNEYTNSGIAAGYALAIARACGAKLVLAYVSNDPRDKDALQRAESAQKRLFVAAQDSGVEVESVVLAGDPVEKITAYAREHATDIVFAASRHESARRRFFVRTVSRELMLKLPCSCAVVRVAGMGRTTPRNILLPLRGGKAFEEERAYFAAKLAEGFGSKVTLFHLPVPATGHTKGEMRLTTAEREKRIPGDVLELSAYLEGHGIPCEIKTAHGSTAGGITAAAVQRKSDLIVMGASRRGLLAALAKASPVEELMKAPPCSIVIFRPKRPA